MIWLNVLHQLLSVLPLLIVGVNSAHELLYFIFWTAWLQEWLHGGDWEDGVETFFECLHLNLHSFMERIVQHKIYVILSIFQVNTYLSAILQ